MKKLALAALLLLPLPAAAQDALIVDCREGTVMLENWFVPETALGSGNEKVLPMHMLLTKPGDFVLEFRSDEPFTMYAYRYDLGRHDWTFLPSSNVAQPASDTGGAAYYAWQASIDKTDPKAEDYLFQAMPQADAQNERHRFIHIRRTTDCPPPG